MTNKFPLLPVSTPPGLNLKESEELKTGDPARRILGAKRCFNARPIGSHAA